MIYQLPDPTDPVDQGDIIDDCPLAYVTKLDFTNGRGPDVEVASERAIVLTQTCDLAQHKVRRVVIAPALDAQRMVADGRLKSSDVRGAVRRGRVFGWYFLPAESRLALPELLVDLQQLYTVDLAIVTNLCKAGNRRARVQSLYREHLAKHFADTYSRIGLPEPYPTEIEES